MATDFLQTIVNHAKSIGLLNLPLSLPSDSDLPILQYADDTLIFMRGNLFEPTYLKEILTNFAEASGVRVNYEKSMMIPINIADDRLNLLANSFGCSTGSLPFTYLGPLVSKCERRMVAFSSFLSGAGLLELTNAILTALPTFAMCSFLLPKTVVKQIDKYRKHCLRHGSDINSKKPSKAAWPMVYLP